MAATHRNRRIPTPDQKRCGACKHIKPKDDFCRRRESRDGLCGHCRQCTAVKQRGYNQQRKTPARQQERALAAAKTGRPYHPGVNPGQARFLNQSPEQRHHREFRRHLRDVRKAWRRTTRDIERYSRPWSRPGLSEAQQFHIRYHHDPEFNLRQKLRAAFRRKRQGHKIGDLLRMAMKRNGSSPSAEAFVGYTVADLRVHLERQFTKGMDWAKFCAGEIHIDHRVPIKSFDISKPDELKAAWAISNLSPAWASDNLSKKDRRILLV